VTDKELADKVVALGVAARNPCASSSRFEYFPNPPMEDENCDAEYLVRDWRVAGALMEKSEIEVRIFQQSRYSDKGDKWTVSFSHGYPHLFSAHDESLPRAIIEACVEALT